MRIYLTGFMGAGKTFLGKLWAEDNSLRFFDLDQLIEEEERTSIEKMFSAYGEDYFREKEAAVLRNTDRFDDCIIACGGGTPCFFDNMQWMNKTGITVFLNESLENIIQHLISDEKKRPLINSTSESDLKFLIKNKLNERYPKYSESKIILAPEYLSRTGYSHLQDQFKNA